MKMAQIILIILDINDFSGLFNNSAGKNFLDKAEATIVNDANPDIHCEKDGFRIPTEKGMAIANVNMAWSNDSVWTSQ